MSQETETETKNDSSKPIVTPNYFTTLRDNYFLVNWLKITPCGQGDYGNAHQSDCWQDIVGAKCWQRFF